MIITDKLKMLIVYLNSPLFSAIPLNFYLGNEIFLTTSVKNSLALPGAVSILKAMSDR